MDYNKDFEHVPQSITNNVNITQHKASVDESIGVLNEVQEKLLKNIIANVKIQNNTFNAVTMYYVQNPSLSEVKYIVRFTLNETEYAVSGVLDQFKWSEEISKNYAGFGNEEVFRAFHGKLSEIIAFDLMKQSPDFLKALIS